MTLVEFECHGHRFALPLAFVRRVAFSARPTPLPGAPDIVLGILNFGGDIIVVVSLNQRLQFPQSAMRMSQRLLVVEVAGLHMALLVDAVSGVTTRETENMTGLPERLAGADFIDAILRLDDGLCIICNPERFLFDGETRLLRAALEKRSDEEQ
jgi:purine-binding chemotaxis protein CheW